MGRDPPRDGRAVSYHRREPAHQPGALRSRVPDPLHEPGARRDLRGDLQAIARGAGRPARRRAVAAADLGAAPRAHRACGRDARAPDLRAGHEPARARPHGARVDGRPAGRRGGRGRSHPGHERGRDRAASPGPRAARRGSAQERVHRCPVPRAAQPAGGDPPQPARDRQPRRAQRRGDRGSPDHRPTGRPAGPPGGRSPRCLADHAEQDPVAAPPPGHQRSGPRDDRGQPRSPRAGRRADRGGAGSHADLRERGRRAHRPGADQPARERGQLHAARGEGDRDGLVVGRRGRRRALA